MKIVRVEPLLVDRFLFVRVHTDEGIVGLGESGAWGHLEASSAAITKFGDYLVGEDPARIEHHWNVMTRSSHFRGTAIMGAVSAIDMALWDIRGKELGVSVHGLLGGKVRDRARIYAHVKARSIQDMVERSLALKARGITAIGHLNPFLDEDKREPYFKSHSRKLHDAVENVRAVREAVGDDVDLCIEIHRRLTTAEAIAFAREIEPFRPMFLEDPIRPDNLDAMAEIAARTIIPIATGERFMSLYEFQMLLVRQGVKYVRVSLCVCGGLTAGRKIAAIAEAFGAEVVPHNPLSPVCLAASLQLDACIPNFAIQEYPTTQGGTGAMDEPRHRGEELVTSLPVLEDGFLVIPDAPGLGVELRPDVHEAFPPKPRPVGMRYHRDGSVVDQ
ncbi:MAG: galactonate dehydratase [Trueperaceae bacterium]|nr:galactonate dehydratase [Trueperaceae bacterium]